MKTVALVVGGIVMSISLAISIWTIKNVIIGDDYVVRTALESAMNEEVYGTIYDNGHCVIIVRSDDEDPEVISLMDYSKPGKCVTYKKAD